MRLKVSRSKNAASLYVTKTIYDHGKERTLTVEKLGTEAELREKLHGEDPYLWAKAYVQTLNEQEKEETRTVLLPLRQSKRIPQETQRSFNGGYLFLQQIYHELGLNQICEDITKRYKFSFSLNAILSRLLYGRILFPTSKLGTLQLSKTLLEQPDFELQQVYRGLEVIAKESDFIQAQLYRNSTAHTKRNSRILYYDCTNYFFETTTAEGLKQYGHSKEHRPNPIVEMGLFLDGDGIPLAFSIHKGNTNEQITLRPLEEQLLADFSLSRFVVCTDAGLSSAANRRFNDQDGRAFITTQSVKKLKDFLRDWALSKSDWLMIGGHPDKTYHLDDLEASDEAIQTYYNKTFYKVRWIKEDGLEQRLLVTFSLKYRNYHRNIRFQQVERAKALLETTPASVKRRRNTDYKRFITQTEVTKEGEIADKTIYEIDTDAIDREAMYDGFYAICTNLEDPVEDIVKTSHRRWEIEESFRILKSDFKARPVYLSRDDRIQAHFTTCFLALTIFRYLEKRLDSSFSVGEIIRCLRDMNFFTVPGEGYIPTYKRTALTDALHETFGFHTDYQIVSTNKMKKIFKDTKR